MSLTFSLSSFPFSRRRSIVFGLLLLAFISVVAEADTVFNNGSPQYQPRTDGYEMTGWIEADDFSLPNSASIESIQFGTIERAGVFTGVVTWQIYANNSHDQPGTLLYAGTAAVAHTPTGYTSGTEIEYTNSFSISPITLPPGTYWLALHNGPPSVNTNQRVYWESAAATGLRASVCDPGPQFMNTWLSNYAPNGLSTELVFRLNGVLVPRVTNVSYANATPRVTFTTSAGRSYRVEYRDNMTDAWSILPGYELVLGNGETATITDNSANSSVRHRFYHVVMY